MEESIKRDHRRQKIRKAPIAILSPTAHQTILFDRKMRVPRECVASDESPDENATEAARLRRKPTNKLSVDSLRDSYVHRTAAARSVPGDSCTSYRRGISLPYYFHQPKTNVPDGMALKRGSRRHGSTSGLRLHPETGDKYIRRHSSLAVPR